MPPSGWRRKTSAPDANGQYSVLLGSTTATGLPSDLFSQEEQRWLGVQVQGQAEQPRVLLVSVPYALKAHEAETLAGKSISEFVLSKDLNSATSSAGIASVSGSGSTQTTSGNGRNKSPSNLQPTGQTFFSSNLNPVVSVTQTGATQSNTAIMATTGTGSNAIVATNTNPSTVSTYNAILATNSGIGRAIYGQKLRPQHHFPWQLIMACKGTRFSASGVGVLGNATSANGGTYGMKGQSASTSGTGVRGLATATMGVTNGISAWVNSPAGIAGVFNNAKGGMILSGQNNGTTKFSVDGSGNVNSTSGTYQIGGSSVVSIGDPASPADHNLFLGPGAGASNVAGSGVQNTFAGPNAGKANTVGLSNVMVGTNAGFNSSDPAGGNSANTFVGTNAGYSSNAGANTFLGYSAGLFTSTGYDNTSAGYNAGRSNTIGSLNAYYGFSADFNINGANTTGDYNTYLGESAGASENGGPYTRSQNTFVGAQAGSFNGDVTGSNNILIGYNAGISESADISNNIEIGTTGPGARAWNGSQQPNPHRDVGHAD